MGKPGPHHGRESWTPGDGQAAGLEMLDGFTETHTDHVPTLDQEVPVASHPDWTRENTRVISCRIANDLYPKDERFESRGEALAAITKRHGKVVEANYVPGRAFFRVRRAVKLV
jgi:hypothetical protein